VQIKTHNLPAQQVHVRAVEEGS